MRHLQEALDRAHDVSVEDLAAVIQEMGFDCTQCGACCRGGGPDEPHTATVYPNEIERLQAATAGEWRDVARPMPYGLDADDEGETFEWALRTTACGDCTFLDTAADGTTSCAVYEDRPLICATYPFQLDLTGTSEPQASVVDRAGDLLAYECEGLGRSIDPADARELAATIKQRSIRDIEEAIAVLEQYEPLGGEYQTVIFDSEGAKTPDGELIDR